MKVQNSKPFSLVGPIKYQIRSVIHLVWAMWWVLFQRLIRGPKAPGWTLAFEISNTFMQMQIVHAFDKEDINEGREYLDSLVFHSPALAEIKIETTKVPVEGNWFYPPNPSNKSRILYFHGGGYAYFAKVHLVFLANVAKFTNLSLFALDYPLIPENPFPAQLEHALKAYEWLIENNFSADNLTIMGDSAGVNLCLALLLKLREMNLPLPSSTVALCPWTDVANSGESMTANEAFDWIERRMADQWAEWFLDGRSSEENLISPIQADFRGLTPIYIQAGGKEILIDMIHEFYERAVSQGADIKLDVWPSMTHDFQAYGEDLEEASEALTRISQFILPTEGAADQ
ncbi:MAG: alpha/beta hydrolase fold domain-containing protein [Anaerolineales bacterium]|nr:alpha/beta hydrolase fold domain-containing protein [Anaerolineales bacterium]